MDTEFLDRVMGMEGIGAVDDFVASLWQGWKLAREEGVAQVGWDDTDRLQRLDPLNRLLTQASATRPFSFGLLDAPTVIRSTDIAKTGRIQLKFVILRTPCR
jgi:hypothetical protein